MKYRKFDHTSDAFEVTEQEVDDRGGFGLTVASVDVRRADGRISRFWLSLYRTNQGRIKAQVRANRAEGLEPTKSVTGVWREGLYSVFEESA